MILCLFNAVFAKKWTFICWSFGQEYVLKLAEVKRQEVKE